MKFFKLLVLFCTFFALKASAQMPHDPLVKGKNDTIRVALTLVDNELIPWLALPEVKIVDTRIWRTAEQQVAYNRLRYNVLKVLPYAMYARSRYAQLQTELARTNNKKEQRILTTEIDTLSSQIVNEEEMIFLIKTVPAWKTLRIEEISDKERISINALEEKED